MEKTKLTKEIILKILRENKSEIIKRFKVKRIGLFGSYVSKRNNKRSDIDILVEFREVTFDNYMDLKFYLEDLFQKKVDLVMLDTLKPRLKPYILKEVQYVS